MADFECSLPIPPSVNAMYRRSPHGYGMFKTKEAKDWITECLWLLKKNKKQFTDEVEVSVNFFFNRERDIDSSLKALMDLFQEAGIYKNDSQVYSLLVNKDFDKKNPHCEVVIRALE